MEKITNNSSHFSISRAIISLALPLALGGIAGIITSQNITSWYNQLNKPSFAPPSQVFGPVWTALYILIGFSCYLVWNSSATPQRARALLLYSIQLALNFAWSLLFFGLHRPDLALADIIMLWLSIIFMIYSFYRIRPAAAYLNIPYLLWVSFATLLNFSYAQLN